MLRLTMLIYSILGATLAGIGVVAALSMGFYAVTPIVVAAAVGAVVALPGSWLVARQLQAL
jgi:hypothetical protein